MASVEIDETPFDKLIKSIPPDLLKESLIKKRNQSFSFTHDGETFFGVITNALQCDLGSLPTVRVLSEADKDREKQISFLLLASTQRRATLEDVMKAAYDTDDTNTLEKLAKELSAADVHRYFFATISHHDHRSPNQVTGKDIHFCLIEVSQKEYSKEEMLSGDQKLLSEYKELKENIHRLQSELRDINSERKQYMENNERLTSAVESLELKLTEMERSLKTALELVQELKDENMSLHQENKRLQEDNAWLQKEMAKRESLERQAMELRKSKEEHEKEIADLKAQIHSMNESQSMTDHPRNILPPHEQEAGIHKWKWKVLIGSGSYGKVFEVEKEGDSKRYAAKCIRLDKYDDIDKQRKTIDEVFKEIKALKECSNRRIVEYIDHTIENDYIYIFMEFMPKGSLHKLGKLDELRVKKFTGQLLEGLQCLERKKVVHRDIKCCNILLDKNEDIKLADFGCVKFLKSEESSRKHVVGSAWWLAPELVRSPSDEASHKSDIWSLGATIVEMLTGEKPFYSQCPFKKWEPIFLKLGNKDLDLEAFVFGPSPGYSKEVQEFLQHCIKWNPTERCTATELLKETFVTQD